MFYHYPPVYWNHRVRRYHAETESGSFAFTGDFNGNVTGQFNFKVVSGSPSGNTLTLTGTVNGNTTAGTWSLTGGNPTGCQGSGTFTMTKT